MKRKTHLIFCTLFGATLFCTLASVNAAPEAGNPQNAATMGKLKAMSPALKEKIEAFKSTYENQAIPLSGPDGTGPGPALALMQQIDRSGDAAAAKTLLTYLSEQLDELHEEALGTNLSLENQKRAENIQKILDGPLPELIAAIQRLQADR